MKKKISREESIKNVDKSRNDPDETTFHKREAVWQK